jgi:hypothetical protein
MNGGNRRRCSLPLVATLLGTLATGCDEGGAGDVRADAGAGGDTGVPEAGGEAPSPVYAVATEVYSPDFSSSVSYVTMLPSLDVAQVDLGQAREYSGRATIGTINGWLFVADAQKVITRFSLAADGTLVEDGKLSFAGREIEYATVDAWGNTFISPTKAYLFNPSDGGHIIWNPSTMEIVGDIATPGLVREQLSLQNSPGIVRGKRLYHMYSWADFKAHTFSTQPQQLAIYDVESDKLVEMVTETRCPSMYGRPFMDEQQTIYFTNFIWNVGETLVKGGPKSCGLRLPAGTDKIDPQWSFSYAAVTGGREAAGLSYLGGGRALLEVFHQERTAIDAMTDPSELATSTNWRLWTVDLARLTGAPVEDLDFEAGGYTKIDLAGRSLLLLSGEDYANTKVYEVKEGRAVPLFDIRGSSYLIAKVR